MMPDDPDASRTTLRVDRSIQTRWSSDEERWAERMKPSRQRNLTPKQRRSLALCLWELRRQRSAGEL